MSLTAVSRRTRRTTGLAVVAALTLSAAGATSASAADAPNPKVDRNDGALVERLGHRSLGAKAVAKKPGAKRTRAAQQRMKRAAKRAGVSSKGLSRKQTTRHHGSNCAVHVVYGVEVCWWWVGADGYDDIFYWELYESGVWTDYGLDYEDSLFLDLYGLGF